ncbi:hypothetical protein E2C01_029016 [Portunus trituberculatus]|uniref:Uncharacterized protein n=1 Tax=Portunus trituberculatus TaxID=210409 RepID=A0A5B7EM87_PORTR|nr:hypothetical protein [Portunus trituberculatus]
MAGCGIKGQGYGSANDVYHAKKLLGLVAFSINSIHYSNPTPTWLQSLMGKLHSAEGDLVK